MELRSQESRPKRTACRAKCLVHRRWKLDGGNSEITSPLERFYGSGFPTRVQDFQKLQFQAYSYIGFCCIDCPSWNVLSFCSGTCPWGEEATCTFRLRCFQEIATTPATINTRIRAQTEQNIRNQTGNNYRSNNEHSTEHQPQSRPQLHKRQQSYLLKRQQQRLTTSAMATTVSTACTQQRQ